LKITLIAPFRYLEPDELHFKEAFEELGHEVLVNHFGSYLTVVMKGTWVDPRVLPSTIRFLIMPDNYERYRSYMDAVTPLYDRVFMFNKDPNIDGEHVIWLPAGYNPRVHYPEHGRKDIDVLFIGTKHPCRDWMENIPHLTAYGTGWNRNVTIEEKRGLYSRAKIVLNNHWESMPGPNPRVFQALAHRSFLITDKVVGIEEFGFIDDKHFITYKNFHDLLQKINYYLTHPDERERIASQGHDFLVKGSNTFKDRVKIMLEAFT